MIGAKAESVCGPDSNAQNLNFNFSPPHTTAQTNGLILHMALTDVNPKSTVD
jgi:hypothetical protein